MVCQQLLGETPANVVVEYYSKGAFVTTVEVNDLTIGGMETARLRMTAHDSRTLTVVGESLGGGAFRLHSIENCPVDVRGSNDEMTRIMVRVGGQISKELGMCCSGCCLTPTGERLAQERAN